MLPCPIESTSAGSMKLVVRAPDADLSFLALYTPVLKLQYSFHAPVVRLMHIVTHCSRGRCKDCCALS